MIEVGWGATDGRSDVTLRSCLQRQLVGDGSGGYEGRKGSYWKMEKWK